MTGGLNPSRMGSQESREGEVSGGTPPGPRFRLVPCDFENPSRQTAGDDDDGQLYRLVFGEEPVWTYRTNGCRSNDRCTWYFDDCVDRRLSVSLFWKRRQGMFEAVPSFDHETAIQALQRCGRDQEARQQSARGWTFALRLDSSVSCLDEPSLVAMAEEGLEKRTLFDNLAPQSCLVEFVREYY